ncbi:nmrA-like family protein [Ophiobolus disseminans]|uniref:NmrA-like family protein n=1 Tax=Ophiobolus disseminans TaxID=1469910 RepID=A0A6A6ZE07_9PLEO|nr:nmrA-like family protein [Ophiobolus disseminans]
MVNIAVAGGTGGIGKAIVEELARQKKHNVVILSRKVSRIADLGIDVLATDYSDTFNMTELLKKHNIEIVISALGLFSPESSQAQLNLINAAIASGTVKKFIPSEYGIKYTKEMLSFHPAAQWWLDASDALQKSHLQFTRIILGWTLDHYGIPGVPSNMKPFSYAIDFNKRRAAIPGDGTAPVAFLHSRDLAKYIAAMLEQDNWSIFSPFAGDRMSWGELLSLAEEVTGTKWEVTYDSVEKLESGEGTVLEQPEGAMQLPAEALRHLWSEFGVMAVRELMDVTKEGLRNDEFPDITPMTVREVVEAAWGNDRRA